MSELSASISAQLSDGQALGALLDASAAMNASLDLNEVLQTIAESAATVLRAEASSVLLLDSDGERLVFRAATGISSESLIGQKLDAKLGVAGKVAGTGEALRVPTPHDTPEFYDGFDEQGNFVTRDMVVAPMTYRDRTIGVVEVLNRIDGQFVDDDIELLQVFANLAAISVSNAQLHDQMRKENLTLRDVVQQDDTIIGDSPALRSALSLIDRVAGTNATVLLLGETGTGKELSARRLHRLSPRSSGAFVAINCAALPETLLESELFGHEAGAFTGATTTKLGRFELADGGTLFLDEIGDISQSTQIKLLRVLQEREFVRVGGVATISCDVRIIAATNRDLKAAMDEGDFREDLYYRLNVFPVHLPPVRERDADIAKLVNHFIERSAREVNRPPIEVTDAAMELLCAYPWPGNIRELRNVMERAVLLCDGDELTPEQLPREILGADESAATDEEPQATALESYERAMIVKALEENAWNQTRTAESLGIPRDNLRYRLKKYDIKRPE